MNGNMNGMESIEGNEEGTTIQVGLLIIKKRTSEAQAVNLCKSKYIMRDTIKGSAKVSVYYTELFPRGNGTNQCFRECYQVCTSRSRTHKSMLRISNEKFCMRLYVRANEGFQDVSEGR